MFFLHNVNAGDPISGGAAANLFAISSVSWWSQTESNRRHPACKAGALPTELWPRSSEQCGPGELSATCHEASEPEGW